MKENMNPTEQQPDMKNRPLNPYDILETPGLTGPRLYRVEGVHYGVLNQECVIELSPIDQSSPDAHRAKKSMFVPNEMIQAGLAMRIFDVTTPIPTSGINRQALKIGQFYTYTPKTNWCREGLAEVTKYGIRDTYSGDSSDAHALSADEKASAVLLFDSADYDELDRYNSASKHQWEQYHPDDRKEVTEQHGCHARWFVKKGAKPDLETKIANARARLVEAESELRSAQYRVESRKKELNQLEESKP